MRSFDTTVKITLIDPKTKEKMVPYRYFNFNTLYCIESNTIRLPSLFEEFKPINHFTKVYQRGQLWKL